MDFWSTYQQWEMNKAEAEIQQHIQHIGMKQEAAGRQQAPRTTQPTFVQRVLQRIGGEKQQALPMHRPDHVSR